MGTLEVTGNLPMKFKILKWRNSILFRPAKSFNFIYQMSPLIIEQIVLLVL